MTPSAAAGAYAATAGIGQPAAGAERTKAAGEGFSQFLEASIADITATGHAAEQAGMQAAMGQADVVDVVTAVAESEMALETMVTLRDRVIQAYEEIMRMPI